MAHHWCIKTGAGSGRMVEVWTCGWVVGYTGQLCDQKVFTGPANVYNWAATILFLGSFRHNDVLNLLGDGYCYIFSYSRFRKVIIDLIVSLFNLQLNRLEPFRSLCAFSEEFMQSVIDHRIVDTRRICDLFEANSHWDTYWQLEAL